MTRPLPRQPSDEEVNFCLRSGLWHYTPLAALAPYHDAGLLPKLKRAHLTEWPDPAENGNDPQPFVLGR